MPHYHIRWSTRTELDWERFASRGEADVRARQLVRLGEAYIIEEHGDDCARCGAFGESIGSQTPVLPISYSWQQSVLEARSETDPVKLTTKINAAQRAIAQRTSQLSFHDFEERAAIKEALWVLRMLIEEQKQPAIDDQKPAKNDQKKDIA